MCTLYFKKNNAEVSDRFAIHINQYISDFISVEFVKHNMVDGGILGNTRQLIPDEMIKKPVKK